MKKLRNCLAVFAMCATLILPLGCGHTPHKVAVDTLATVGQAANSAYEGYLQSVLQGLTPTNDVPKVTALYRDFQAAFGVAAEAAIYATNTTVVPQQLYELSLKLTTAITQIKGTK